MSVKISVPGKLMILGEHAVVYGYSCIVSSVNKYLCVEAEKIDSGKDIFITPEVKDNRFVKHAVGFFKNKFNIGDKVKLSTKSNLGNFGLGSSAAVTVGTIKTLSSLFGIEISEHQLFDICLKIVLNVQKKASGFDIASSIHRHTIYFSGKTKEADIIFKENIPMVVGFSGEKASTNQLVENVTLFKRECSSKVNKIFIDIGQIVEAGKCVIQNNDWEELGRLMNNNHSLIKLLGVSTQNLDVMVNAACKAGAYGAKLSGAGGGDCMIACVPIEKKDRVEKAIEKFGGQILKLKVGSR